MTSMEATFGPSALATPANAVTMARVGLTPVLLAGILASGASWPALALWIALASTDGVDGYLARRHGTTRSGAFLDPLADKFLALGGLCALSAQDIFPWVAVGLVTAREVGISAYRAAAGRRGVSLPARRLGKYKTVCQLVAVGLALFPPTASRRGPALAVLWLAVALTLVSGLDILFHGARAVPDDPGAGGVPQNPGAGGVPQNPGAGGVPQNTVPPS
jgi:CDP-diacylglycerol---glycerol-3-phosphate 3-phosphatidyltransferase